MKTKMFVLFIDILSVVGGTPKIDDIHLIMEYDRDATWGEYATKRANRFH